MGPWLCAMGWFRDEGLLREWGQSMAFILPPTASFHPQSLFPLPLSCLFPWEHFKGFEVTVTYEVRAGGDGDFIQGLIPWVFCPLAGFLGDGEGSSLAIE